MHYMFRLIKSATKSVAKGLWQDPEVQKIAGRHPKAVKFIKHRLTPDEEFGLHLTIGVIITAIFVFFFFSILQDLIGREPLIQADLRIISFLQILRVPVWNNIMLFITYMGNGPLLFLAVFLTAIILLLRSRWHYVIALLVSIVFGEMFLWIIKNWIERPRPPITNALLPVAGYSFPSGHAFVAFSFYGLLFYFLGRTAKGKVRKAFITALGVAVIFAIGFSRIYLGVHWLSDVLASYASGAALLTVIITALEINRKFFRRGEGPPFVQKKAMRLLAGIFFLIWISCLVYYYHSYPLPHKEAVDFGHPQTVSEGNVPEGIFSTAPRYTEGISGRNIEPINVVIVATPDELLQTFQAAGWQMADQVSLHSLARLARAALFHQAYSEAPGTPTFWEARVNDFSLEQPTGANSIKERHHIHIWAAPYVTDTGKQVWVGTAHFDQSIALTSSIIIPTHRIDPAVDKERDKIKKDLFDTKAVDKFEVYQMVEPSLGKNFVGGEFFTDGKAYIFFLK